MRHFLGIIREGIVRHRAAFLGAFIIGTIYVTPYIVFAVSLGNEYKGIPIMAVADEDYYIARMREILDGHPLASSPRFFEYKNQYPLAFTAGEFFYALPAIMFHVSLVTVLIASKFILPALLFLLVYFFVGQLSAGGDVWQKKLNAIAAASLVVLGHDLIDFRNVIKILSGATVPQAWLLWSRPVHPIMGALFLFSFLLCVMAIIKKKRQNISIIMGAMFLSLMVYSYFFSWGAALSILFVLGAGYWLKGRFDVVKNFLYILLATGVMAAPYWYVIFQAQKNPWYQASVLHSGLFLTHYPLFNNLLAVVLAFFVLVLAALYFWRGQEWSQAIKNGFGKFAYHDWVVVGLALLVGGLVALNQQIITGKTIWPFHFVQYTIPLSLVVICVVFYNIIKKQSKLLWSVWVVSVIGITFLWGIYNQAGAYKFNQANYRGLQVYGNMLNWLNQQPAPCVALMPPDRVLEQDFGTLLTAFTHCDTYAHNAVFSILMPIERRLHNYYTILRFKGIQSAEIEEYLTKNQDEARAYLFSNWSSFIGFGLFPDFKDYELANRLKMLPDGYREFLERDLKSVLDDYRLDYIVTLNPLQPSIEKSLPGLSLVYSDQLSFVYSFSNKR